MDKELLEKVKRELPQGAITEIAIDAKVSRATVYNFLKGKNRNQKVMVALNKVYAEYKKASNELTALAQTV